MHGVVFPLMAPGVAGSGFTVTVFVEAALELQLLFAVTEIVPLVLLGTTLIVFDVDEPVHPPGKVHV